MKLSFAFFALAQAAQDTSEPTQYPTASPTKYPTKFPTATPTTREPTKFPTAEPTLKPKPTAHPTAADNCVVKLYKNCFYEGYVGTFGHGNQYEDLGDSIAVTRNELGEIDNSGVVNKNSDLKYAFNDDISSVEISGNCAIYMYDQKNFHGDAKVLTKSTPCLVDTEMLNADKSKRGKHENYFNDQVSSFKVASLYFDNKNTAVEDGNKWVSNEAYDHTMVVVKNTPFVTSTKDGKIMKFVNSDYPKFLDHRQRYVLAYAEGGIGSEEKVGARVVCKDDYCKGENLQFTYNSMSARLITPTETAFESLEGTTQKVMIQTRQGEDVPAVLQGNQMDWKKNANHMYKRGHSETGLENDDCSVTIYEECQKFSTKARKGKFHKFYPGHYAKTDALGGSLDIRAVELHGDCKVRLYNQEHFGGEEQEILTQQECMDATILEEFHSQVSSHLLVDGVYVGEPQEDGEWNHDTGLWEAGGPAATHMRKAPVKHSLRVASLELVHHSYPTPYPTAFPTASPTFTMDMPECPLKCTYHARQAEKQWNKQTGQDMNVGHMIKVIHQKDLLTDWRNFRAQYPTVLAGLHSCWHELPGGVDEVQDSNVFESGTKQNHQDYNHFEAGDYGGCHCRCS